MDAFGVEFGKTLGQLVTEYRTAFAWVALVWHLSTLAVLYLVVRYDNRYRRVFAAYFTLDYLRLVGFVGIWMSVQLYERMGVVALAAYGATPVFLLVILYQWVRELRTPRLDLDLRGIERWRLLVAVPMVVWGFWYPPYIFGVRLDVDPAELLFGAYGLMDCPTTMVALGLLFLTYPAGDRRLFHLLTAYAVFVGAAMVALLYLPDIPLFVLGVASLALIVRVRRTRRPAIRETAPRPISSASHRLAGPVDEPASTTSPALPRTRAARRGSPTATASRSRRRPRPPSPRRPQRGVIGPRGISMAVPRPAKALTATAIASLGHRVLANRRPGEVGRVGGAPIVRVTSHRPR